MNKWAWLCPWFAMALPRENIPGRACLARMAMLFCMTTTIAAAAEIKQHRIVGDIEIVMAIPHAGEPPESRVESQDEHHLVIWLSDRVASRPIADALVKAEVAEAGYAGAANMLQPRMIDGKPAYSGFFMMPRRVAYRISVQVWRPGVQGVIETHFEYRHHHRLREEEGHHG